MKKKVGIFGQDLGLDLITAKGMAELSKVFDARGYQLTDNGRWLELNHRFFSLEIDKDYEQPPGLVGMACEAKLKFHVRPAFRILHIRQNASGKMEVLLVRKDQDYRDPNIFERPLRKVTEIPGDFYRHSEEAWGMSVQQMEDLMYHHRTGIQMDTSPDHLRCIGVSVDTTAAVHAPTSLWICDKWEERKNYSKPGVEFLFLSTEQALTLAANTIRRVPQVEHIEDSASIQLLYLFDQLIRSGEFVPNY